MLSTALKTLAKTTTIGSRVLPVSRFSFSNQKPIETTYNLSTNEAISKNVGVNKFLSKVYTTTGLSFMGALGTSYAVLSIPALSAMMMPLSVGGIIATLTGFISMSFMKPTFVVESEKLNAREKIQIIKGVSSPLRKAMFGLGVLGLGLSAAPLVALSTAISPSIVPTCLGLTAAIFGGASMVAYNMKKDSMLKYSGVLGGSLLGLIGLQLIGLAASFIIGPNPYSLLLFSSSNYIAVGLFTAFIAYDTHVAIKQYELGTPDHLGMTSQFLLDLWNIFTSLLRIFSSND